MDGHVFIEDWLKKLMIPALAAYNIEAIFVLDNASYHLVPAPGSVCVNGWTNKTEAAKFMDNPTNDVDVTVKIDFIRGEKFPARVGMWPFFPFPSFLNLSLTLFFNGSSAVLS